MLVVVVLLVVLTMVGAGALGLRSWQQMQDDLRVLNQVLAQAQREQDRLQEHIERASQALQAQTQRIEEYDRSFQAQRQALEGERRKLQLQEEAMRQAVAAAQQRLGSGSTGWMLAEAEYLMRLAQRRLSIDQDVASAREALSAADQRLRDTGDPQWAEVRDVLAGEVSALAAVPVQVLEQTGRLLATLSGEVQRLPLSGRGGESTARGAAGEHGEAESEPRNLQTLVQEGLAGLEGLMSVRYHEVPASGLLPPPQRQAVYQNLLLQLETAQYALLRRDPALYQASLAKARAWLQDYFDPGAPQTVSFRERLEAAGATDVRPPMPDISASLRMLQRRREQASREGRT